MGPPERDGERPEARTSPCQHPGCAGPRDICHPRSRLTPHAPPQLPGRCHPPRSGCRLSLRAQTLGPRLRAPRQLPRVAVHGGARLGPERAASWAVVSRCRWLSRLRPYLLALDPPEVGSALILSTHHSPQPSLSIPESGKTILTRLLPRAPSAVPGAQLMLNTSPTPRT